MYGVDLGQMWRGREWRKLLNLLLSLPRTSLFKEAMSQDDEFYAQVMDDADEDSQKVAAIRYAEFSPEVEALYVVSDRLGALITQNAGKKGKSIKPMPRPQTAASRYARLRRQRAHDALVARVLPNR